MEQPEEATDAPDGPRSADVPEAVLAPEAGRTPRRRGRTAALIGAALVLGLVAGTCTGYLVQADREPTPLPPLSQPVLTQAKGKAPEPLSTAQDRRLKTDGDLRKLLIKRPRSARPADWLLGEDGWMDLAEYAGYYEDSGEIFGQLAMDEFRRVAVTGWFGNDYDVEIRLVQFRQEETLAAAESVASGQYWADEVEDTDSWRVPGTEGGRAYVHDRPTNEPGYEPMYSAEAHAWRGDVAMEIWVNSSKPVSKKMIMDLAERQMEQL
ncbi:hypothetical protein AB0L56_14830 [Streptomyces sp. NPDC052079]|uniref:hypothetical protein n=1 Tax=Streptomyces sp. NPDC052079 TaxID=3155526 RepID=UPI0034170455